MRVRWPDLLVLMALCLATAAPLAGRADEMGAGGEVAVPATEERSASATTPPAATTAKPWWGTAVDVTPKPWWRGTGEEPWRFNVAGYLWLPDAPADIFIGHGEVDLPENLGNILDDLQMAVMMDVEARKGRFGGYVAPVFVWLRQNETVQGPIQQHKVSFHESVYLIDFGLSYEVGQWPLWHRSDWILSSPAVTVEPFFGARSLVDDIRFEMDPPGRTFEPEISFITPVIGLNTFWDLTDRFNIRIGGDYGGFNVDHVKRTYDAVALLGYRFKPRENLNINVFAGYRYLSIHYKKVAEIEVAIKGAFLGLAFEFGHK